MKRTSAILLTISFALVAKLLSAQTEVTFYTTMGNFVVTMEQAKRPITTTNFLGLVNTKFYDGIIFHRVIAGFMIQGGDPTGTGYGGSGITIMDELTPPVSNLQKVIAMAKTSAPNSATSQFFINLVNNTYLDPNYSAFGTVITGFSVVQAIGVVPTNSNDKPLTDVVMDSVRVTFSPTGIVETSKQLLEVDIYPNPISKESIISINSNSANSVNVTIYDQLGSKIYSEQKDLSIGINTISFKEIRANDLAQGMYYLVIGDDNSCFQQKFMIGK